VVATLDDVRSTALGVNGDDLVDRTNSQTAIDNIDSAMETLSASRTGLGATINVLNQAVSNLMVADTSFGAAVGTARDADIGQESMTFAREQVLQQAGIAMIAQSNTIAQNALRLLS